jgi:ABC-2 type transport system permease protein
MASNHHNLGTVIWFEFIRTIKKPSFWIATLSIPILIAVVFAVVFYSSKSTSDNSDKLAKEKFSIEFVDESKVLLPQVTQAFDAKQVDNKDQALEDVRSGKVDAFFYYPNDVSKQKVEVYGKDVGLFDNGKYQAVAENLLKVSANTKIGDPQLTAIAQNQVNFDTVTYKADGNVSAGWLAAIPPLIFLVLFYFTIAMLGNNLLNSTVEEKENRVTEMILTTMNPTDLIVGKLIATFMAGIMQALVLLVPIIAAYLILGNEASVANLPSLDVIKELSFDPYTMTVAALVFIGGMLLFTGTLVAVGAVMPTAKEAGQYFGIAIMLMFIPFYIIMLILSDPSSLIVQIFTYFPFTAPVTALLRNAFGSLSMTDAIIVITELFILGLIIIRLSVKLFRYGAMEYSGRLSLSTLFNKD